MERKNYSVKDPKKFDDIFTELRNICLGMCFNFFLVI